MKKINFILTFCLFSTMIFAQAKLQGKIFDLNSKEPLLGASIYFQEGNKGVLSSENGSFNLELPNGNHKIKISYVGYTEKIVDVKIEKGKDIQINNVLLVPTTVGLNELLITANSKTSTQKIDRQTYRASDFQTAQGGTATDLLSKLPSISVDPDGSISVRGTTDFIVYLNGKPTQIDPVILLGQISTSQIDKVEVISIPTSKYDAQGKGGIINITTKKTNINGLSVTTNGLLGGSPWHNFTDPLSNFKQNDNRLGAGLNIMYFKDKISIYGGINFNNRNVNGMRTGDARILVANNTYRHMIATGERPEWYNSTTANIGLDYKLSEKSTLSGSYFYGQREDGRSAFYIYNNFFADKNKNTISGVNRNEEYIYNPNTDDRLGEFQSGNIDFSHKFDKTSDIKVSALFEHSNLSRELSNANYQYNNASKVIGSQLLEYQQTDDTPLNGYRLSIDYAKTFIDGSKLGLGFQPQHIEIEGNFNYDTLNISTQKLLPYTALENTINLSRGIYAGYIDYTGSIGNLNYIAGVRMEYTDQEVNILSADYFSLFDGEKKSFYETKKIDFFHTLHLSWEPTKSDKFNFATSRRISRPPLKNMTPFLYRRHLEVYEVGDPQLKPEYMLNFELSYNKKVNKQNFGITGFYRGVDNAVFRVNTVTNQNAAVMAVVKEDVLIRSYTNAGNSKSIGAELNANLDAGKFAKFYIGGALYNYSVKGNIFGYLVNNNSLNWNVKSNMNLNLTNELKFAIDFNLKSATITAQGQNDLLFLANAALNFAPQKLKGWDFSLRALDFLGTNMEGLDTQAFNSAGSEIFYQTTDYFRKGQIVELGISYSFNAKGKSSKKAESTFGKEQF